MQIPIFSLNKIKLKQNNENVLKINNFSIHRGAAYFINGNMAAGKTMLLNLIAKRISPESGTLLYEDEPLENMSANRFSQDIAYVEQNFKISWFNNDTVENFMKKLLGKYKHIVNIENKISNILKLMDIKHLFELKLSNLTPGELRWVILAANIAADTKVLIIDELEQHLGPHHIKQLNKILYRKCNYDGVTLIASTQNKSFFQSHLASVIITLERGKIFSVRSSNKKNHHRSKS